MKKLLSVVFALVSMHALAQRIVQQKPVPVVEIDFEKKEVTLPYKTDLRKAGQVQVKINKLPLTAYKVSINKTDSVVSLGTPPALMGVLSFGDGFNSLLAGLSGYTIRNVVASNAAQSSFEKMFSDAVRGDTTTSALLLQLDCSATPTELMERVKTMRRTVFGFHYTFRDEVIKKADNLLYRVSLGTATAQPFKQEAEAIITNRLQYDKDLETAFQAYYDYVLPCYDKITGNIALATGDSMLGAYKKSFALFLNKFDTTFNETGIAKIYKQLSAVPQTTFTSLPYTLKGDITKLNIEIAGIDPTKTPQPYATTIELERNPNRLWAFTTGVYLSSLASHDFSILTNVRPNATDPAKVDTLNYSILQEKNNKVSIGINALMNFGGYFGTSEVGGFVSFGPGLSLEKAPQLRLLLGGGFLFGRANKVALSGGLILGSVKRLATNYTLSETYTPAPVDITRDRFKTGWYVSFGYALFGK